jgi:hypothetical protein
VSRFDDDRARFESCGVDSAISYTTKDFLALTCKLVEQIGEASRWQKKYLSFLKKYALFVN